MELGPESQARGGARVSVQLPSTTVPCEVGPCTLHPPCNLPPKCHDAPPTKGGTVTKCRLAPLGASMVRLQCPH